MTADTLPLAPARARLLDQYVVACPGCAKPGAAHVDQGLDGQPILIRFVCPMSCAVAAESVLACLRPTPEVSLTA